ncbi:Transcriptional regulator, LysR family [Thermobacillus xylanilyticus]|uniref:Transcriptional regulator, LysR family n=1 Tax=Thermobacillus xylanilyticus TaxID=76633 RepID=A0ABM8V2W4_THEXY|nr:LysR family transcriptional regulator [Thermobacillus xylanilyticus]CAG5083971.1 Transcriptional regulator, LysR family [Thermobacillus xylanilyticus]
MIDFEWYRSFVSIYRHNSVSEAAKSRFMTQPAMSQHLASLEAEVGEKLFVRMARKMIPTERGKLLYSEAAPLVEALEKVSADLKTASLPGMKWIKIGSAPDFYQEKILPLLPRFGTCSISHFGTAEELVESLEAEKVDLIITSKKFMKPGIEYEELGEEEFVIIAPAHWDVPETRSLAEQDRWLAGQKWIAYGPELPIIRRVWREHFKKRPKLHVPYIVPNLHMILALVGAGAGLSVVPAYLLQPANAGDVRMVYSHLSVRNALFFAYKSKHKYYPEIQHVMKIIRENL